MSRHDIMTLASIIEKEARLAEERPVISAVYHNRLRIGMLLQADPTVQYALGKHVDRVLYKDLEVDSRYNTYKHVGLPPGPIASPGAASIEAALYPANVPTCTSSRTPTATTSFDRRSRSTPRPARKSVARILRVLRAADPSGSLCSFPRAFASLPSPTTSVTGSTDSLGVRQRRCAAERR
jgi:UPF0755 protein